eukprot:4184347-Prymnesium_polylepis.1
MRASHHRCSNRCSRVSAESVPAEKRAADGERVRAWAKAADVAALIAALKEDAALYLSEPDEDGYDALHHAVMKGHVSIVRVLVASGANLENIDRGDGSTPLMLAVRVEHTQASSVLIEGRANVHAVDRYGHSLLRWAARSNQHRLLQQLLEARGRDETALATGDELGIVLHPLNAGHEANVRMSMRERDGDVNEAMRVALRAGHADSVRVLFTW